MTTKKFEAVLERPEGTGAWTYLRVPLQVSGPFGAKGQIKVKGTINGLEYRSTLMPQGDGTHYLVVKKEVRDQIGATKGSKVQVVMELDNAPRKVDLPADFKRALAGDAAAKTAFTKMAYSHQKEYLQWIEAARRPETRARRIGEVLKRIVAGQRLKR